MDDAPACTSSTVDAVWDAAWITTGVLLIVAMVCLAFLIVGSVAAYWRRL